MNDALQSIDELEAENQSLLALVNEQAEQILALRDMVDRFAELANVSTEPKRRGRPRKRKDLVWLRDPPPKQKGRPSNIPEFLMPIVLDLVAIHIAQSQKKFPIKDAVNAAFDTLWDLFEDEDRRSWLREEMTREYAKKRIDERTKRRIAKEKWLISVRERIQKECS
jgi:hypothetical protein